MIAKNLTSIFMTVSNYCYPVFAVALATWAGESLPGFRCGNAL